MAVVEVICKNLKNNPQCPHGPTLKFVKVKGDQRQEFFACSTFRDRKDCGFYLPVGDKLTEKIKQVWDLERERTLPSVDHTSLEERLREVGGAPVVSRLYCHTCSRLDLASRRDRHKTHQVQSAISDRSLAHPTTILRPKEGNKREAQYLFSSSTVKVVVDNLRRAGVDRVLCLGTPRVHEYIQSSENYGTEPPGNGGMESLLLDMDHRYHSFWPRDKFVWFNMFNRHFFSADPAEPRRVLRRFVRAGSRGALVMDPPFGGHVDPLAATVRHFSTLWRKTHQEQLKVIWIFPYFRERHITKRVPELKMLDYKVEYDNHKDYSCRRKLGSPARLFTNLGPSQFVLPEAEGYRFCRPCARWVALENKHCRKCDQCTSKDGRTYRHCDECGKCVKPRWQHCRTCQNCLPTEHICATQVAPSPDENIEPRHKRLKKMQQKLKEKTFD